MAAGIARQVADEHASDIKRFVAGSIGPTNRTASLSASTTGILKHLFRNLLKPIPKPPVVWCGRRRHSSYRDGIRHTQRKGAIFAADVVNMNWLIRCR